MGAFKTPKSAAHHLSILGRHAYLASGTGCLQIVDISDPANPFLNTSLDTPNVWLGVQAVDGNVYMVGVKDSKGILEVVEACIF